MYEFPVHISHRWRAPPCLEVPFFVWTFVSFRIPTPFPALTVWNRSHSWVTTYLGSHWREPVVPSKIKRLGLIHQWSVPANVRRVATEVSNLARSGRDTRLRRTRGRIRPVHGVTSRSHRGNGYQRGRGDGVPGGRFPKKGPRRVPWDWRKVLLTCITPIRVP